MQMPSEEKPEREAPTPSNPDPPEHKAGKKNGRVAPCDSLTVNPPPHHHPPPHGNPMAAAINSPGSKGWTNSSRSDSMDCSAAPLRPHTGGDVRWDAITSSSKEAPLGLPNFRLLKRLGYGDIGSVYLVELRGSNAFFAMKVMDKSSLVSRNKLLRAQTEREILGLLDHPFLPTLYTYFETDKFYCLVMEFCSGGNLHSLRQKQPSKHFSEEAARSENQRNFTLCAFFFSILLILLSRLDVFPAYYIDLSEIYDCYSLVFDSACLLMA